MGGAITLDAVGPEHWAEAWSRTRDRGPLVYTITNFVAAQFQANVTLAVGGRPVMSRNVNEAAELASRADILVVNTGTPDSEGDESMRLAMEAASTVLLDPVGYGASAYRTAMINGLLRDFSVAVVKGNWGEICRLAGGEVPGGGVDAPKEENGPLIRAAVLEVARRTRSLTCATGAVDYMSDGLSVRSFTGGSHLLAKVTGGGCALGSLMGTVTAGCGCTVTGCTAAIVALRLAAERAEARSVGPGTFRAALVDELYGLSGKDFFQEERPMKEGGEGLWT